MHAKSLAEREVQRASNQLTKLRQQQKQLREGGEGGAAASAAAAEGLQRDVVALQQQLRALLLCRAADRW
jgi:hypothetical protein